MKKIISIFLVISMLLCICACTPKERNEIGKLLDEGFYCSMSRWDETKWVGIYAAEDNHLTLYKAIVNWTKKDQAKFDRLGKKNNGDELQQKFISSISDITLIDLSDKVPTKEFLDSYIGKTIETLLNEGYSNSGYTGIDGGYALYFDGPLYSVCAKLNKDTVIADINELSEEDLKPFVIESLRFDYFSDSIFEEFEE